MALPHLSKGVLVRRLQVEDGPAVHAACSVAASLAVATSICPLDILYTQMLARQLSGWACAGALLREHGPAVFFRGWTPLWARFLPSSVLTFLIYEQARRLLGGAYLKS